MRFFNLIHVCMKDHDEACMRFIFHSEYESHVMINVEILAGSDPGSSSHSDDADLEIVTCSQTLYLVGKEVTECLVPRLPTHP